MIEEKLDNIYSLYEAKEYKKALSLNNEILKEDPNNIYAKRYSSLLLLNIKSETKSDIPKVKWKQLKCPHCESKISFSALNESQQKSIKSWKYNNLEIKCPYCHTKFVLQKKTSKSILGLKIWEVIKYEGRPYRITWYVEYEWKWIEKWDSWHMKYIEWLLLWRSNDYIYFSEWYFYDDWVKQYEFEFSQKFIPKEKIDLKRYKEKNLLTVKSIYWENSKSYKVWETVEILDFWDYVLEKEWSWKQLETWFYKWIKVNKGIAAKIFNKKESWIPSNWNVNLFSILIVCCITIWPLFSVYIAKPLFWLFNKKELIEINEIDNWPKYEIIYWDNQKKVVKTVKYDYWGVRTYYEQKSWIKFSVKSIEDKDIINKIIEEWSSKWWEIEEIWKWKAYIIK